MRFPRPLRSLRRRQAERPPPAPFVVGVARSGTTLLRLMLDAHPALTIPPETHFIPKVVKACRRGGDARVRAFEAITTHRRWPDFQLSADELRERFERIEPFSATQGLRAFYRLYAEKQGKPRWGDKSPSYVRRMPRIHRALPEARFVHLIRDGRDVALSLVEVHFGPESTREAAEKWAGEIRKARADAGRLSSYTEVRYEDLVRDPEPVLRRICEFCELPFDPAMLDYHAGAEERMAAIARDFERRDKPTVPAEVRARQHVRVAEPPQAERSGRWRTEMPPAEREAFEGVAGDLLADLGYEVGGGR